ncbi:hypothetical protein R1sor_019017 [Riccia sorocarpa]|uniref:Uncharacterized protein n=1 Tax=Riccia sorocarpa TaxID=122646 RepID=A0ABD3IBB8_9MARC
MVRDSGGPPSRRPPSAHIRIERRSHSHVPSSSAPDRDSGSEVNADFSIPIARGGPGASSREVVLTSMVDSMFPEGSSTTPFDRDQLSQLMSLVKTQQLQDLGLVSGDTPSTIIVSYEVGRQGDEDGTSHRRRRHRRASERDDAVLESSCQIFLYHWASSSRGYERILLVQTRRRKNKMVNNLFGASGLDGFVGRFVLPAIEGEAFDDQCDEDVKSEEEDGNWEDGDKEDKDEEVEDEEIDMPMWSSFSFETISINIRGSSSLRDCYMLYFWS